MKRTLLTIALAALVLQCSCVVRSVYPWFGKSDVVFENDLLGGWIGANQEGQEVAMTFLRGEGDSYLVQYSGKNVRGSFVSTLGKIGGEYYLDFRPVDSPDGLDGLLLFPTHSVARLEIGSDKLVVRSLNYDGLKSLARSDRFKDIKVAWDDEDEMLVVSNSDELRHFLIGYSRNSELFTNPMRLARKRT